MFLYHTLRCRSETLMVTKRTSSNIFHATQLLRVRRRCAWHLHPEDHRHQKAPMNCGFHWQLPRNTKQPIYKYNIYIYNYIITYLEFHSHNPYITHIFSGNSSSQGLSSSLDPGPLPSWMIQALPQRESAKCLPKRWPPIRNLAAGSMVFRVMNSQQPWIYPKCGGYPKIACFHHDRREWWYTKMQTMGIYGDWGLSEFLAKLQLHLAGAGDGIARGRLEGGNVSCSCATQKAGSKPPMRIPYLHTLW